MKKILSILLLLALCLTVFIACGDDTASGSSIETAGTYLFNLYKDDSTVTNSDYDVAGQIILNGTDVYTIEWTVDDTANVTIKKSDKEGFYTVDINEKTPNDVTYTLTATIKSASGETITKTFTRTIPAYKLFSYAEYAAAADDDAIVVEGVVIGIVSKSTGSSANSLYLQDVNNDGGYYVYNLTEDPITELGIKIGMTVNVSGVKDTYSGLHEVVSATATIVDSTIKTVEPLDYTEIYKSAAALTDASLVSKQSLLVTLKGVEITGQDTSNGYYKFKLGDKETYIRISSSNNCLSADEIASLKQGHSDHAVWQANVTGIVQLYSGAFYLIPADANAFEYLSEIQKTDAEKVEMEKDSLSLKTDVMKDTELELTLTGKTYSEVAISWSIVSDANGCATINGSKLALKLQEKASKVTVKATITCGAATDSAEFEISVAAIPTKIASVVDTPVAGTAYKLMLTHTGLGKDLYVNGEMSDYYYATTESSDEAVDVYLEEVTGGYNLYCMKDGKKQYMNIIANGTYINVTYSDAPETTFTYDATLKTLVAVVGDSSYVYGTSGSKTYNTFSANKTTYTDTCVAHFVELVEVGPNVVDAPVENTAYKFMLSHEGLAKNLYITGEMNGYYYDTTENVAEAVDVYLEAVSGGYNLYCMKDGKKLYMNIVANGTYINVTYTESPASVFTYDSTLKTVVATVGDTGYVYSTNKSKTYSTISSGKAASSDELFIAHFVTYVGEVPTVNEEPEVTVTVADTPAESTAYKFMLTQAGLEKDLFITGEMDGYYYATTSKASEAADVYVEAVSGGYNLYCLKDGKKQYMNIVASGTYINVTYSDAPATTFTYDATLKTFVATVNDVNYFYGTYGTYKTFSANKTTSTDAYVAHLVTVK